MLRIGDIHIHTKHAATMLDELQAFIDKHANEKHLVFMGDYVYHFQYDRKLLLQLFHFFLGLVKGGKYVYVLAGNHDWIHNHFIYEEAQYAFALAGHQKGAIHFVTEPRFFTIEDQDCLFFPYTPFLDVDGISDDHVATFDDLLQSEHTGEQLSGKANACLASHIARRKEKNDQTDIGYPLCVFHHWYVAETTFPGQKSVFHYKHHALSPSFAQMDDVLLVSGHIHHPFVWNKYICVGSIWSTSPLEINQTKFLFHRNTKKQVLTASAIEINPYIRMAGENEKKTVHIDASLLSSRRTMIYEASCQYLSSSIVSVICTELPTDHSFSTTTLTLEHETLSYEDMTEVVDEEVLQITKQVVLKRQKNKNSVSAEDLDIATDSLDTSIANWKELLTAYITKKREKDADVYLDVLQTLKIIS